MKTDFMQSKSHTFFSIFSAYTNNIYNTFKSKAGISDYLMSFNSTELTTPLKTICQKIKQNSIEVKIKWVYIEPKSWERISST
jgi:hypothetical protein